MRERVRVRETRGEGREWAYARESRVKRRSERKNESERNKRRWQRVYFKGEQSEGKEL